MPNHNSKLNMSKNITNSQILFIVSAPSGAGKTTLIKKLLNANPQLHLTVSCTTRKARDGEIDGVNYFFISHEEFNKKINNHEFAEFAHVYDNYYGTPKNEIDNWLNNDRAVIAEVDWQGAQSLRLLYPHSVSVFILPPSLAELEKRLIARGKDSPDVIAKRLANCKAEIAQVNQFDFVIVNNDFSQASHDLNLVFSASKFLRKQNLSLNLL